MSVEFVCLDVVAGVVTLALAPSRIAQHVLVAASVQRHRDFGGAERLVSVPAVVAVRQPLRVVVLLEHRHRRQTDAIARRRLRQLHRGDCMTHRGSRISPTFCACGMPGGRGWGGG